MAFDPSKFWGEILSRDPDRIRAVFVGLPPDEQTAIWQHLREMVTGEGWHPPQRESAQVALDVLADFIPPS